MMDNDNMVDIRLHGPLGERYGTEHRFAVSSPREAIEALDANHPGFRRDFLAIPSYGLLVDGDWRDENNTPNVADAPAGRQIDFCPIIEGQWFAPIVAGLGYIGITGITATILAGIISTGLMIGISMLLAPKPKKKTTKDSAKDENYMFSGPENVTEQGVAVPVIYGRCHVGSVVVSAGLEVAEGPGLGGPVWIWNSTAAGRAPELSATPPRQPMPEPKTPAPKRPPRYVPGNA